MHAADEKTEETKEDIDLGSLLEDIDKETGETTQSETPADSTAASNAQKSSKSKGIKSCDI